MRTETLATPQKGTSWFDLLAQMEAGEEKPFPFEKRSTIQPIVSSKVKLMFPTRVYSTNKEEIDGETVLMVRRTA